MLQTLEAEILPNGHIHFLENFSTNRKVKAYVTILSQQPLSKPKADWHHFVGALKESSLFQGDPVEIQKTMRDEWA